MRIQGWECTVNHDGTVRTAKHTTEGVVAWINGRIIANGDVPQAVVEWLMRPRFRQLWMTAFGQGRTFELFSKADGPLRMTTLPPNPYEGEPPNKDNEPS